MFSLFSVFFLMYYLCGKYYKSIILQYYVADCVNWVPRLTLLDFRTHSWKEIHSYVSELLY